MIFGYLRKFPDVDDLTAIMEDLKAFFDELEQRGFGLKGVTDKPDIFLEEVVDVIWMVLCIGGRNATLPD
jgi:hypothetical protein